MKLSISLSALLVVLPALVAASSPLDGRGLNGDIYVPRNLGRRWWHGSHHSGSGVVAAAANNHNDHHTGSATSAAATAQSKDKSKSNKSSTTTAAVGQGKEVVTSTSSASDSTASIASTTSASDSTSTIASTTSASASTASIASNNNNNSSDPNTSLTLSSDLVETGLEQNGQAVQEAGQVPSLTSSNNFINFCAGQTITNGQQITTGSCDPIPMGDIIPKANQPNSKFVFPKNFSKIPANQAFTIQMALNNLQAGVFTNAQKTYYMAPQQLNGQGIVIGHTHFVIQPMGNFDDPTILDPATFTFFKGVDTAQVNGVVSVDVTAGVPAGNYRLASINTNANHAPVVVAVAQHGSLDDMVYFTAQ
jgi:hypothetical protein